MKTLVRMHLWFDDLARAARNDDRGALSTEAAIVTALLAAGGVAIVGLIVARATGWADAIPGAGG